VKSKQKTTMKNKMKILGLGLGMVGISMLCQQAQANANLINGSSIAFAGIYTADGTGAGDLVGAANITSVLAGVDNFPAPTGSFAGLGGLPASFTTPISLGASSSTVELWSVNNLVDTFEFWSTGNTAAVQTGTGASIADSLSGTGWAEEIADVGGATVAGPTSGTWELSVGASGSLLVFDATSTVNGVPDGGTTLFGERT